MDEIGISLAKEDPTLPAVISDKKQLLQSLPQADEELYAKWKRLEGHEEFLDLQEVRLFRCSVGRERSRTCRVLAGLAGESVMDTRGGAEAFVCAWTEALEDLQTDLLHIFFDARRSTSSTRRTTLGGSSFEPRRRSSESRFVLSYLFGLVTTKH